MKITFIPSGACVDAVSGESVLDCARRSGVLVEAPCDGRGRCGRCAVRVSSGTLSPIEDDEAALLRFAPARTRLACRARVTDSDVVVEAAVWSSADVTGGEPVSFRDAESIAAGGAIGIAVDLGSTTVAASLVGIDSGVVIATSSAPNRQAAWGADVLSRVNASLDDRAALRVAAERSIVDALHPLLLGESIKTDQIESMIIAGNSVMAGLLVENPMGGLLAPPFESEMDEFELVAESLLREQMSNETQVTVLAPLGGFVGGDTVAAAVATRLVESPHTALLVDLGTNAEIALWSEGTLYYASAAAGPAFEGAGITCGGPAAPGAVVRFVDARPGVDGVEPCDGSTLAPVVFDDIDPLWLSGSGIVSLLARLRRCGVIDSSGRLMETSGSGFALGRDESGVLFVEVPGSDGALRLTQLDIRAVQLAKAAVCAGVTSVLAAAGVAAGDLERVYVAGAFGAALDPTDLVSLGVLPVLDVSIIESVGNAALAGAQLLALSDRRACDGDGEKGSSARPLERLPRVHVRLSGNPAFEATFMSSFDLAPAGLLGK